MRLPHKFDSRGDEIYSPSAVRARERVFVIMTPDIGYFIFVFVRIHIYIGGYLPTNRRDKFELISRAFALLVVII